ncbi:RNA editing ligase, putative [Bodo saltans]|uniref:RNA ligase (ATP) n=1 Tax=Bodo saltans TaxID=75058 RepID=A0A0S4IH84_BODSA|nr:RNA editing ligase, putative [Bodo saltans]|eukprot:CUE61637.1 RNA editing ligase, putative [Bodo saltans]
MQRLVLTNVACLSSRSMHLYASHATMRRTSALLTSSCSLLTAMSSSSLPPTTTTATTAISTPVRHYAQLPHDQTSFSAYVEIDLPSESRIDIINKSSLGSQEWVAIEKVHGTNFGIYLMDETTVRFSKRSGLMDPNENFFGYHVLVDEFTAQIRILCDLIKQKFNVHKIGRVVLNGELFGARYKHPLVPKSTKWCTLPNGKKFPLSGVRIQNEPFPQYSPELHFFAFDLKYSVSGEESDFVMLGYDDFVELCSKTPNLMFAKALVRGTLNQCLAFDVENFVTPIPALLGLGNYPLEGNLAEGVIIRHVKRGAPEVERVGVATIIKLRCSSFMELKHPGKQQELKATFLDTVRAAAVKRSGGEMTAIPDAMLPAIESAANALLLNNVSDGRLNNVLSKIGREPLLNGEKTKQDLTLLLAKDALKDFLKEIDTAVLNTALSFRKMLITNVYNESKKLVDGKWKEILKGGGDDDDDTSSPSAVAVPVGGAKSAA